MNRLAVARLWLEVNSFSPVLSRIQDFKAYEWLRGREALDRFASTPTELGAVASFARSHPDWEVVVSRCAAAIPGGPMEERLFNTFVEEVLSDLSSGPWDAVYLSLHGALATSERSTPDLDLVQMVREQIGGTPLGVTLDMHANVAPAMADLITISAGYKTLPHIDMYETASKVLGLLERTVAGAIKPVGAYARAGCMLHSFNMRTTDGPMREIEECARKAMLPPILDVTPYGGFPFMDSPNTGASVLAYADESKEAAIRAAEAVSSAITVRAAEFSVQRPSAEEGLRQALKIGTRPVAVLECADNIYSGGIADTPGLLRALISVAPVERCVFAFFSDPELVAAAYDAGLGTAISCRIGGKVTSMFGESIEVQAKVVGLTEGTFRNIGPMFAGVEVRLGRTAVLRVNSIDIIITEGRQPVNDRAYFTLHGIDLADVRLLCVKAKNHFRAAFSPACAAIIEVDTAGPAMIDLTQLPFRYAPVSEFV